MSNNYYKEMVRLADSIADKAHEGQTDRNGWPYISHPRRVALGVRKLACELAAATHPDISLEELKAEAQIVALLHDTWRIPAFLSLSWRVTSRRVLWMRLMP